MIGNPLINPMDPAEPPRPAAKALHRSQYNVKLWRFQYEKEAPDTEALVAQETLTALNVTTAVPIYLGSSSGDDQDDAAGAVRTVVIQGVTSDDDYAEETVALSGVTAVATANTYKALMGLWAASWGSAGTDAAGNIVAGSLAYHTVATPNNATLATETGLADATQYYFKVNLDGAGAVEYDITTAGDTTFAGVIALMNTAVAAVECTFDLTGASGKLRATNTGTAGTSGTIALTAGTTGADLFATLTGWTAFDAAVDGFNYLKIATGTNQCWQASFKIPTGWKARTTHLTGEIYQAAGAATLDLDAAATCYTKAVNATITDPDMPRARHLISPTITDGHVPDSTIVDGPGKIDLYHVTVNTDANVTVSYFWEVMVWKTERFGGLGQ